MLALTLIRFDADYLFFLNLCFFLISKMITIPSAISSLNVIVGLLVCFCHKVYMTCMKTFLLTEVRFSYFGEVYTWYIQLTFRAPYMPDTALYDLNI